MLSSFFANLPLSRKILLLNACVAGGALFFFSVLTVVNFLYLQPEMIISHPGIFVVLMVAGFITSLGVGLIFTAKLQRKILQPVVSLAGSAKQIVELGDYSLRAESSTKDEVGDIITNFNLILEVILLRDEQLKEHKRNLDFLVEQRTEEFLRKQDDAAPEPIATS